MRTGTMLACLGMLCAVVGCSKQSTSSPVVKEPAGAGARRAMLTSVATRVIVPTYESFVAKARDLESATQDFADTPNATTRAAAQAAWRDAMDVWEVAEAFQFGPAGVMGTAPGGEDFRDNIYAWPFVTPCRIDQETVEKSYESDTFGSEAVNTRTLAALEYLLFHDEPTNHCAANANINTSGSWAALSDAEIQNRRATYAHVAAKLAHTSAKDLLHAWAKDGGNFLDAVATAGDGSKVFSTSQAALNALSDAMFYVEKEVKDMKVGIPVGRTGCDDEICPEDVEAPFSGRSKEHILANLKGFELVFLGDAPGTDAEGFDDLLVSAGAEALATKIKGDITTSREALENVDGTLEEALVSDKQSVDDVYDAMNAFVRDLKTEFVSVLDLELPKRVEADAD